MLIVILRRILRDKRRSPLVKFGAKSGAVIDFPDMKGYTFLNKQAHISHG